MRYVPTLPMPGRMARGHAMCQPTSNPVAYFQTVPLQYWAAPCQCITGGSQVAFFRYLLHTVGSQRQCARSSVVRSSPRAALLLPARSWISTACASEIFCLFAVGILISAGVVSRVCPQHMPQLVDVAVEARTSGNKRRLRQISEVLGGYANIH